MSDKIFFIKCLQAFGIILLLRLIVGKLTFPFLLILIFISFFFLPLLHIIRTRIINLKRRDFFIKLVIIFPLIFISLLLILKGKTKSSGGLLLLILTFWSIFLSIFTKPSWEGLKIKNFSDFLWFLTVLVCIVFSLLAGIGLIKF